MSFAAYEESEALGHPVNLYKILTGPGEGNVLRYTDHDTDYAVDEGGSPATYVAVPIMRSALEVTGSLDRSQLVITLPVSAAAADLFRISTPSYVVTVFIFQTHIGDPTKEYQGIWSGRVLNCKFTKKGAELVCEPIASAMRRMGLRRNWQLSCPHALYGPQCKAVKQFEEGIVDNVISGNHFDMIPALPLVRPLTFYVNGTVQWDVGATGRVAVRNIRVIANNAGVIALTIGGGLEGLAIGDTVRVLRGCQHIMTDCIASHNNILNFGGQPWIPIDNPIHSTSLYI